MAASMADHVWSVRELLDGDRIGLALLVLFGAMPRQKLGRNRGDCCTLLKAGKPKWKSRLTTEDSV